MWIGRCTQKINRSILFLTQTKTELEKDLEPLPARFGTISCQNFATIQVSFTYKFLINLFPAFILDLKNLELYLLMFCLS